MGIREVVATSLVHHDFSGLNHWRTGDNCRNLDEMIRAFDRETGKVRWKAKLPSGGYATPSTYLAEGRQFVVIACGGGRLGSKFDDTFVAFALPAIGVR